MVAFLMFVEKLNNDVKFILECNTVIFDPLLIYEQKSVN